MHEVKITNNIKFKENEDIKLRKKVDLGELAKSGGRRDQNTLQILKEVIKIYLKKDKDSQTGYHFLVE